MTIIEIKPPTVEPAGAGRVTALLVRNSFVLAPAAVAGWFVGDAVGAPPALASAAAGAWAIAETWLPRPYLRALRVLVVMGLAFGAGVLAEREHLDVSRLAVVAAAIAALAFYGAWRTSRDASTRRVFLSMCLDGWARQYKQRLIADGSADGYCMDHASLIGRVVSLTLQALHEDRRLTNRDEAG